MAGDCPPLGQHASVWAGRLVPDGSGGYVLHQSNGCEWPVITLEPAMQRWMLQLDQPVDIRLVGVANPWGPWLRVSGLA